MWVAIQLPPSVIDPFELTWNENSPKSALVRARPRVLSGLGPHHEWPTFTPRRSRPFARKALSIAARDEKPQMITRVLVVKPSQSARWSDITISVPPTVASGTIAPIQSVASAPLALTTRIESPTLAPRRLAVV